MAYDTNHLLTVGHAKQIHDTLKSAVEQNLTSIRKAFPASNNLFNISDATLNYYLTNTGAEYTSTTLAESGFIAVEPSTAYTIGSNENNYPRYITEFDADKHVIANGGASEANITTTASTAYIRFAYRMASTDWRMNEGSTKLPYEPFYYDYIKTDTTLTDDYLPANAKSVGDALNSLGFISETFIEDNALNLTFTDGYIGKGGGAPSSSSTLHYSNEILVSEGDTIYTDGTSSFRFVCAYNANGTAVSASGAESVTTYTVPEGIAKVIITTYKTYTGEIRQSTTATKLVSQNGQFGYFRASGNMNDGDALVLPETNANKNIRQAFSADITNFSGLLIGRKSGTNGRWVSIDSTNITLYVDNVADVPVAHGLTIENNIQVRIISHADGRTTPQNYHLADITLTSNGVSFTLSDLNWIRSYNNPTVESVGSTLTNCVHSWEAGDINKAIYAFGDSYFSWYPERWTYYLSKDGFADNVLTNAYAGEPSSSAIVALRNLVPMGKPKYLLWCLGMNDGSDGESTPNTKWVKGRDAVLNLCKQYGITPVFGTIPTVPSYNHEQKNAWIRSSGYRYIDFAKAVGAQANGEWYSGMLESDHVHPTAQGAKALYGRALTDFPELMVSN